jgi:pyrimidine deaminase RibD-like protein
MIEKFNKESDLTIQQKDALLYSTLEYLNNLPYGQKSIVAASVFNIYTNEIVYACSVRTDPNKNLWNHAEYMAVQLASEKSINPSESILITTLSPCVKDSSHRAHQSCSEILLDAGYRNVHTGLIDKRQASLEEYRDSGFDMSVTENPYLRMLCGRLDSFFDPEASSRLKDGEKQNYITEVLGDLHQFTLV